MQIVEIISAGLERYSKAWQIQFRYTKDNGESAAASLTIFEKIPWNSPDSIAEIRAPGCAEPVGLPCPEQIKVSAFNDTVK